MSKEGQAKKQIIHFYCYIRKDYELKTSPHFEEQRRKFEAQRKAEAQGEA